MKKILCILIVLVLAFSVCACGKKGTETEAPKQNQETKLPQNEVTKVAEKAEEITVENTDVVPEVEKDVAELKKQIEEKADEMKKESEAIYQNRQVAVAIMEEALNDIKAASEANDEEKLKQATNMFKMAQSLWDYDDSKTNQ